MAGFDIAELLKRLMGGGDQPPQGLLNAQPQPEPQPVQAQAQPPQAGGGLLGGAKAFFQPDPEKREALDSGLLRMGAAMMAGGGASATPKNLLEIAGTGLTAGAEGYDNYRKSASEMGLANNKVRNDQNKLNLGNAAADALTGESAGPVDPETGYSMGQLRQLHTAYLNAGEFAGSNTILDKIQALQQAAADKGMSVGEDGQFADRNGFNAGLAAQEAATTTAKQEAEAPFKTTSDITEYNLYRKQEEDAGRAPLDFTPWVRENKKSGASQQNVRVGETSADSKFAEESAKEQAKTFGILAADYGTAKQDLASIGELRFALKDNPGGLITGVKAYASSQFGIKLGDNAGDIEYANAMINKLIPQQRPAGSGSMSDRDVEMFKQSLPNLMNTPTGNTLVLNTMEGMANYRLAMADIAQKAQIGPPDGITRQEAIKQMNALPDPLTDFKAQREAEKETKKSPSVLGGGKPTQGGPVNIQRGQVVNGFEFQGGDPNDQKNWKAIL